MKTPQPLRYTVDLNTFSVIDRQTGERIQCADIWEMARVRRDMELAAMPAPTVSKAKAQRLTTLREKREAGVR